MHADEIIERPRPDAQVVGVADLENRRKPAPLRMTTVARTAQSGRSLESMTEKKKDLE